MGEQRPSLTQADLECGFYKMGLSKGMILEVHSSLSSFGYVEGGAVTVIQALMKTVGQDGALIMPTFPVSHPLTLSDEDVHRGITYKTKVFDECSDEKSGMGIISDTFRKMDGVSTGKGEHRVSAWGKDAEENSKGFSNLIMKDGHALLIGVDIYRLTSMHYVESKLPTKIRNTFEASEDVLVYYPKDQWYVEIGAPPIKAWYMIQDEAYKKGLITDLVIGESKCMFFKVNDVIRIYERAIETDPYGLYGLKP
jgi:aminoglycoside N3'-acetyltransferase